MKSDPAVHVHELPNGLTLLAEPMTGVQSAAFSLMIPAGAAYEPAVKAGSASLLAEWVSRGAGARDSRQWLTALDFLGVSHGLGAQTTHATATAVGLARNLVPALELYADALRRPRLDDDEVEPIRSLALQSLQSLEDDPGSKVMVELRRRQFADPWGRSAPGNREGIEAVTAESLRDLYRRTYRPNGTILGVAGAIDWPALRDTVERLFADWEPVEEPVISEGPVGTAREHLHQETQQTQIALAFPAVPPSDPAYYEARAAAAILGGYPSARLFTEVREKRGLCYSVFAGYETLKDRAAVVCYAGTSVERAGETLAVTLDELERLVRDGIDADELDLMRAGLKSSLVMQQESSLARSSALAGDWYHRGRVRTLDEIAAALDALTPGAVGDLARRLPIDRMTIVTLGPRPPGAAA